MGSRTQKRSEYFILVANHVGLYQLCGETEYQKIRLNDFIFHLGSNVKTHVDHTALCPSLDGLLALGTI